MDFNKRNHVLDLIKVICIVIISINHVLQRVWGNSFISSIYFEVTYALSLAGFFFVGGYLVKRCKTIKDLLLYFLKLVLTYLLPAYAFTCLTIFTLPRYYEVHDFEFWMGQLFQYTDIFYWYFLVAAIINFSFALIYFIFNICIKKDGIKYDLIKNISMIIASLALMIGFKFIYDEPTLGPKCLGAEMIIYYTPISGLGFLINSFKKYFLNIKHKNIITFIISLIFMIGYIPIIHFCKTNWLIGLSGTTSDIVLRCFGSIFLALSLYFLLISFKENKVMNNISRLGKYTGPMYLIHVYLIRTIVEFGSIKLSYEPYQVSLAIFIAFIFTIGCYLLAIFLVEFKITNLLMFVNYQDFIAWITSLINKKRLPRVINK